MPSPIGHGARVTALFGIRPRASRAAYAYSAGAALRAFDEEGLPHEHERDRLRDLARRARPDCTWCEVAGDSLRHAFVAEAIYADLLILGAPAGADEEGAAPHGFVESVILESGTPAIVVPHPARQETIGERVLVAWNGSTSAARALKAALPLMRSARRASMSRPSDAPAPVAPFSRLDVVAWLRRHDIDAELHASPVAAHVANDLVARRARGRCRPRRDGLLRSQPDREQVFGGVTRALLANLPAPILMTH